MVLAHAFDWLEIVLPSFAVSGFWINSSFFFFILSSFPFHSFYFFFYFIPLFFLKIGLYVFLEYYLFVRFLWNKCINAPIQWKKSGRLDIFLRIIEDRVWILLETAVLFFRRIPVESDDADDTTGSRSFHLGWISPLRNSMIDQFGISNNYLHWIPVDSSRCQSIPVDSGFPAISWIFIRYCGHGMDRLARSTSIYSGRNRFLETGSSAELTWWNRGSGGGGGGGAMEGGGGRGGRRERERERI